MDALAGLIRFQIDRGLYKQPFEVLNEQTNILEELLEASGLDIPKENRPQLRGCMSQLIYRASKNYAEVVDLSEEDVVDAFADVITFAVGAIMKLGYDPEKVVSENSKEINSRVGKMIDGKFEKDLSDEAKRNWYKADYSICKMEK